MIVEVGDFTTYLNVEGYMFDSHSLVTVADLESSGGGKKN